MWGVSQEGRIGISSTQAQTKFYVKPKSKPDLSETWTYLWKWKLKYDQLCDQN